MREKQLQFDIDYNLVLAFWNDINDIPKKVKKFITTTSDARVVYDTVKDNYHCAKCLGLLDINNYCPECKLEHNINSGNFERMTTYSIDADPHLYYQYINEEVFYYVFDVINENVILYKIKEHYSYIKEKNKIKKVSDITIDNKLLIEEKGITLLNEGMYYPFDTLSKYLYNLEKNYEFNEHDQTFSLFLSGDNQFVYVDNLDDLKNTCYKYTHIWDGIDFLKNTGGLNLAMVTVHPLYYKEFEYLLKYKLYNLAFYSVYDIKKGKTFKDTFGVEKNKLKFMIDNNISIDELEALRLVDINTKEDLSNISFYLDRYEYLIKEIGIDYFKLKKYLSKMEEDYFFEYYDYIRMCVENNFDMKDNKVLYPDNLLAEHDKLFLQTEINQNKENNIKLKEIANILEINKYDDNKYIIYPPKSVQELLKESRNQNNCVRVYTPRIISGECQVYFMREKNDKDKSLVTIEVRKGKVVQALGKYNKPIDDELKKVINKWEKTLVDVDISN